MNESTRRDWFGSATQTLLVASAPAGAAAAKYIDAYCTNIDWDRVAERLGA